VANTTIPATGRARPALTDAASNVPTNGPTQANDESANVSPISSVPAKPPVPDDRFSLVSTEDGMVISNAPSRLSPKAMNRAEMKPFTQGLEPSCLTPTGPSSAVTSSPSPEKRTMMPRQKTTA